MNIFWLHLDPATCAQMLCDKHVVKMILELCQMLWCAHHQTNSEPMWVHHVPSHLKVFKATHVNHPMCIWVRKSVDNYLWAAHHAIEIGLEYTRRYNKVHKCQDSAMWLFQNPPACDSTSQYSTNTVLSQREYPFQCTPPPLTIDKDCIRPSLVDSYRLFYIEKKSHFATWKNKSPPRWFKSPQH